MDKLLRRKVDSYLMAWKNNPDRKPLIIKGARQIGKTRSLLSGLPVKTIKRLYRLIL